MIIWRWCPEIRRSGARFDQRILTFSRPVDVQQRPLKLGGILKEGVKLLHATLPSSINIQMEVRTEEDVVVADATEMHQVIAERRHECGARDEIEGRPVEIRTGIARAGGHMRTATIGVPARAYVQCDRQRHGQRPEPGGALSEFFRTPFFCDEGAGTGHRVLGAALVHKIVERCGGQIKVTSEEGRGTTFHVYLPLSEGATIGSASG